MAGTVHYYSLSLLTQGTPLSASVVNFPVISFSFFNTVWQTLHHESTSVSSLLLLALYSQGWPPTESAPWLPRKHLTWMHWTPCFPFNKVRGSRKPQSWKMPLKSQKEPTLRHETFPMAVERALFVLNNDTYSCALPGALLSSCRAPAVL